MSPDPVPPVLVEVEQRRVGKVVVTYLALAFAVVEGLVTYLPAGTPDLVRRVVLGILVLGFPVTVVLSWIYDITPTGVVRTPDDLSTAPPPPKSRTWLLLTVVGVVVGVAIHVSRG